MKDRFIKTLKFLSDVLASSKENQEALEHLISEVEKSPASLFEINKNSSTQVESEYDFPIPSEVANKENAFAVFSDGACRGNPGPGSWGVMAQDSSGKTIFESSGVDIPTTNNKMELEGAIQGLELLKNHLSDLGLSGPQVFLFSDSKYVTEGITQWVPSWKQRGWKKADKKEPDNLDLWQRFDNLVQGFDQIEFLWVKGHDGHPQNEHCDLLANKALDEAGF